MDPIQFLAGASLLLNVYLIVRCTQLAAARKEPPARAKTPTRRAKAPTRRTARRAASRRY